jgi:hypothetical protein
MEQSIFAFPMLTNLFPDRTLLPSEAISSVVLGLASDKRSTSLAAPSPSMPDLEHGSLLVCYDFSDPRKSSTSWLNSAGFSIKG